MNLDVGKSNVDSQIPNLRLDFPGFELIRVLGASEHVFVYLARQRYTNRLVAIKGIKAIHQSSNRVAGLRQEAEIVSRLEHPNIVRLLELVESEATLVAVFEYVAGGNLRQQLAQWPFTFKEAARLAEQLARALQFAHDHAITHADLKPDNVLLTMEGHPKIADFGIALDSRESILNDEQVPLRGTPQYMAPEQIQRKMSKLGPSSDIHALGAILYELVTGRPPFVASNTIELLRQICLHPPVPPRQHVASLPVDLETITLRCLVKDPFARYATAGDVADDLQRFLLSQPINGRRVGFYERGRLWTKRNPVVAALLASLAGVLIISMTYFSVQYRTTLHALKVADELERQHEAELIESLRNASENSLSFVLESISKARHDLKPVIRATSQQAALAPRERTRFQLALVEEQPELLREFADTLASTDPKEFRLIVETLESKKYAFPQDAWESYLRLLGETSTADLQTRPKILIARLFHQSSHPLDQNEYQLVAEELLTCNPLYLSSWIELLQSSRPALVQPLSTIFLDRLQPADKRSRAANLLAEFASDQPQLLMELILVANDKDFLALYSSLEKHGPKSIEAMNAVLNEVPGEELHAEREIRCERRTNAALVLMKLGQSEAIWPLLRHSPDPSLRCNLIHRFRAIRQYPQPFVERLATEPEIAIQTSLWLTLGEYISGDFAASEVQWLIQHAKSQYATTRNPGLHAACEWFLRQWKEDIPLIAPSQATIDDAIAGTRDWFLNSQGQGFAVIRGPIDVPMGSPDDEPNRVTNESRISCRIERSIAVAVKELTVGQYQKFIATGGEPDALKLGIDYPARSTSYLKAIRYCRWLSEQEGLPESEMCYPPDNKINSQTTPYPNYLSRTGYRLPSSAELECILRAGTTTRFGFSDFSPWLSKYAWFLGNAGEQPSLPGRLKPNDFGLFDTHGNVREWGQESSIHLRTGDERNKIDFEDLTQVGLRVRALRGGGYKSNPNELRCAYQDKMAPTYGHLSVGIRLVRTLPLPIQNRNSQ